jgi:carbon-monoxide dehydrogenase large subunit
MESQVRVIAPHAGGGFGPKNPFYPEELVVPAAAYLLGAPVKWIEDRRESFTATNHEREQDWDLGSRSMATASTGGARQVHHDHGSATPSDCRRRTRPPISSAPVLPAVDVTFAVCLTNLRPPPRPRRRTYGAPAR